MKTPEHLLLEIFAGCREGCGCENDAACASVPILSTALSEAYAEGRAAGVEDAAKVAEAETRAPGQRNAKDLWREEIGSRIAVVIRAIIPRPADDSHASPA